MDRTPRELRRHAEHCRRLADSQTDERVRLILQTMASEFEDQATAGDAELALCGEVGANS